MHVLLFDAKVVQTLGHTTVLVCLWLGAVCASKISIVNIAS